MDACINKIAITDGLNGENLVSYKCKIEKRINLTLGRKKLRHCTKIASNGLVLSPQGAFMVLPWQGSQTQVTICPALRTALIK